MRGWPSYQKWPVAQNHVGLWLQRSSRPSHSHQQITLQRVDFSEGWWSTLYTCPRMGYPYAIAVSQAMRSDISYMLRSKNKKDYIEWQINKSFPLVMHTIASLIALRWQFLSKTACSTENVFKKICQICSRPTLWLYSISQYCLLGLINTCAQ